MLLEKSLENCAEDVATNLAEDTNMTVMEY